MATVSSISLSARIAGLREEVYSAPIEALPRLLGQVHELEAEIWLRLHRNCWLEGNNYTSAPNQQLTGSVVVKRNPAVPCSDSDSLLDVEAAAQYLGMSSKWLYRHYKELPHILIGAGTKYRIRFRKCDLDEWLARRRMQ